MAWPQGLHAACPSVMGMRGSGESSRAGMPGIGRPALPEGWRQRSGTIYEVLLTDYYLFFEVARVECVAAIVLQHGIQGMVTQHQAGLQALRLLQAIVMQADVARR